MLSFRRVVCVVAVCAMVSVVIAGAQKIRAFETMDPEPAAADGMAIINHIQATDTTIVQVILSDFTPNQEYCVLVDNVGSMVLDRITAGGPFVRVNPDDSLIAGDDGSLVADDKGHLTVHLSSGAGAGNDAYDCVAIITVADWELRTPQPFSDRFIIKISAIGGPVTGL